QKTQVSSAVRRVSSTGSRVIGRRSGRIAHVTLADRHARLGGGMIRRQCLLVSTLTLVCACNRTPPRADPGPDAAPSPASTPPASASAPDPGGGLLVAWAKEDKLPIGELFDKSTFLTGALFRRIGAKHDRSGIASLTDAERNIFLSYTMDAEERFGGFAQYF